MGFLQTLIAGESVSNLRSPARWLVDAVGGEKTAAGENIGHDSALTVSTYKACLSVISEDVAKLPLIVYKRLPGGNKERAPEHPLYSVLHDRPNEEMTAVSFRETLTQWAAGWGNGYAEIVRSGSRLAMYPIHPSRVIPKRSAGGNIVYETYDENGRRRADIPAANMFHLKGMGNGLVGYSVLRMAAESLGLSLATQKFGSKFFGNGAQPSGAIKHPGRGLTPEARENIKKGWNKTYGGENQRAVALLEEGTDYVKIGIDPESGQFLETRQFQTTDICRFLRIPPHKVMDLTRATFTNIEHQSLEYVTDTLMIWLRRFEQEAAFKLLPPASGHFAEHNVNGLLRGDSKSRSEFYTAMFRIGVFTINMICALENINGIGPEGDERFMPLELTPVKKAIAAANVKVDPAKEEETKFKREFALRLLGDGTTNDVVFNLTNGKQLLTEAGITTDPEYVEPWLPVVADQGPLVSGEVIRDSENDIVGGDVLADESAPTSKEVGQPTKDESAQAAPEATSPAVRTNLLVGTDPLVGTGPLVGVMEGAFTRIVGRMVRKESKHLEGRPSQEKSAAFYERHLDQCESEFSAWVEIFTGPLNSEEKARVARNLKAVARGSLYAPAYGNGDPTGRCDEADVLRRTYETVGTLRGIVCGVLRERSMVADAEKILGVTA